MYYFYTSYSHLTIIGCCMQKTRYRGSEVKLAHATENNNINVIKIRTNVVTSFSVAVAVDKKAKILCGQLSNRCTTCRRFD